MLNTRKVTVFEHSDLEKLLKKAYNIDMDILELTRDIYPHFSQDSYVEITYIPEEDCQFLDTIGDEIILDAWINDGKTQGIYVDEDWINAGIDLKHIMQRLLNDGLVLPETHIMLIWW